MKPKKLLMLVYPFPPVPYSGTHRMIRLCKRLAEQGVEIDVVSIPIRKDIPNDFGLLEKIPGAVTVHRSWLLDPWLYYQNWRKKYFRHRWFGLMNRLFSMVIKIITIPDHQVFWLPFAIATSACVISRKKIDHVFISSPPNSTLIAGLFLKKFMKVNFIADFRDPVVGNIAEANIFSSKGMLPFLQRNALRLIERMTIRHADVLIANTISHREDLRNVYGRQDVYTVRNAFDEDDYSMDAEDKFSVFTIAHLGSVYGLRKPDLLFKAIHELEKRTGCSRLDLNVLFVGLVSDDILSSAAHYGVENYVTIRGMVTHQEAIRLMQKSHLLLLLKASGPGSFGQVPAKFYEYLGSRNPIIYIGASESEVARMMRQLNAGVLVEKSPDRLIRFLEQAYHRYRAGELMKIHSRGIEDFSSHQMAKQLLQIVFNKSCQNKNSCAISMRI